MKVKTPFFILEIEYIFLIVFFIFLFSYKVKEMLFSFFTCYLFIVFHELSHILVASILGKYIEKFKVTLAGVCVEFKKEKYNLNNKVNIKKIAINNIFIYLAGPISNIILAKLFYTNEMIFQVNLFFAIINLLPLFPLDGYNILENIFYVLKVNQVVIEIFFKILTYLIYFILILLGIFLVLQARNFSICIFVFYLFLIQKQNKKNVSKYMLQKYKSY